MCGIAGYLQTRGQSDDTGTIVRMSRLMTTRGPDDEGFVLINTASDTCIDLHSSDTVIDAQPGSCAVENFRAGPHDIALAHRRFSIVDLSAAGHQPLWSQDHSVCVVFNGEIYNYPELRRELEAHGFRWRGHSDTEVLVAAYQQWGEACFEKLVGFWAIALYDRRRRRLMLSRDRLGKAPLYIARHGGRLYFASEIKCILEATGRSSWKINDGALADYAYFGRRDVDDTTMWEGITTFPAASFGWVKPDGGIETHCYWSIPTTRMTERQLSPDAAVEGFREKLSDAVEIRLRADVPVGLELSGGLDSSTMVALVARRGHQLRAFTASFAGDAMDEEPFARQAIAGFADRVSLTPIRPGDESFWDHADAYVAGMDEPIHAVNTFTYHQVWRAMASQGLRVSISGAAGDELLAGYHRDYYLPYLRSLLMSGQLRRFHRECTRLSEKPAAPFSRDYFRRMMQALRPEASGAGVAVSSPGSAVHYVDPSLVPVRSLPAAAPVPGAGADVEELLVQNMGSWRMNYWMRVAHQSAMLVPLEVRQPFLDHRLVELCFTMPVGYLIRDGWMKWVMRKAMTGILPDAITWRPRKWGFRFPYSEWLLASRGRYEAAVRGTECPYIDGAKLAASYDALAKVNPILLWRAMNIVLWWRRVVLNEPLGR